MTLPPHNLALPNLDNRRYDDLVAEALRRVPRYTPEWTNHNDSDPGKALIGLNAWLTETLLYQINQVPLQNYTAFLNLLGIAPQPARAAATELTFALKPLALPTDPLTVNLPAQTRVAVDDPDLATEVVFETAASARALNAAVGLALVPRAGGGFTPVTEYDVKAGLATWLHAFDPFALGTSWVFALVLRPTIPKPPELYAEDRLPSGELDLYVEATEVYEKDALGAVLTGPLAVTSGPLSQTEALAPGLLWEVFTGAEASSLTFDGAAGWEKLGLGLDDSAGLTRSGHVALQIPANVTPVPFDALSAVVWDSLDLIRPPATLTELQTALNQPLDGLGDRIKAALTEADWATMGIPADKFSAVLGVCTTGAEVAAALTTLASQGISADPAAIPAAVWGEKLADFAGPKVPVAPDAAKRTRYRKMYFFRVTRTDARPRLLNAIRLNTVPAVAASTRADELLGTSNGRPGQSFTLSKAPVWFNPTTEAPDIEIEVTDPGAPAEAWTLVPDFYDQGPERKVYVLDPITGRVQFGDGRPRGLGGAIPPPGALIRALRYRFGGGAIGNVGAGSVSKLKGAITGVASVMNLRATTGGSDAETLDQVLGRAPARLRSQDRAMSAEDFADLARRTPGVAVHKAYAVAAAIPSASGFDPKPGAVSVVILPLRDAPRPQPTEAELTAVQCWLDPRRLVTTELHLLGPRYFEITRLQAQLRVAPNADLQTVAAAARAAVTRWLHPVTGGPTQEGWPFGTDIYHADLYDLLLDVAGVRRVARLAIDHQDSTETAPDDVIPVPEGHLPALREGALDFEVIYDRA